MFDLLEAVHTMKDELKYFISKFFLYADMNFLHTNCFVSSGRWGSVCGTLWTKDEANVVCHQLGFDKANKTTYFTAAASAHPLPLHVICSGSERSLTQCLLINEESGDCLVELDAGVVCGMFTLRACRQYTQTPNN